MGIDTMCYKSIRRYLDFREKQILKEEAIVPISEFKSLEDRLEILRREGDISHIKYGILQSQIRSMRRWNKELQLKKTAM